MLKSFPKEDPQVKNLLYMKVCLYYYILGIYFIKSLSKNFMIFL